MPDEVTLDVTTIEENVTVETTAGDVVGIQVVAPTGPAGATGPAGPNSVTSATTSDGTGQIMLDTLAVGICNILDEVVFDTLTYTFAEGSAQALKDALDISFADISDAQTGTADLILENLTATNIGSGTASIGLALIVGDGDSVKGRYDIFGNTSHFQWYSDSALYGERSFTITTDNLTSSGSYVYKYPVGNGTLALTGNTNGEPDKLTAGTISGATTFNATSYTYGTGAAAAHRTALGLTTLATTTPAANVATFLATPSSANLAAAVTDETGSGALVFGTSPTLTTPTIAAINGGTAANDDITIQGTTNATRTTSYVNLQPSGGLVGIGTSSPLTKMHVSNGSNTLTSGVDAVLFVDSGNSLYNAEFKGSGIYTGFLLTNTITTGVPFVQFQNSANAVLWTIQQENAASSNTFAIREGSVVGTTRFAIATGGSAAFGTATPSSKAILELASTTKGFLPPRMTTTQRNAITSVPAGLMVYNTTLNKLNFYNGTTWETVTSL